MLFSHFLSRDQKWLLSRRGPDSLCKKGYISGIWRCLSPIPLPLLPKVWAKAHFAQGYWGLLGNHGRWIKLWDANSYSALENFPVIITISGFILFFSVLNPKQIPKEVADIFNAPSDDEDFVGFGDDVPMETLSSEESCDSFDSLESGKQVWMFPFKAGVLGRKPGSWFKGPFLWPWSEVGDVSSLPSILFCKHQAFMFQETGESTSVTFAV